MRKISSLLLTTILFFCGITLRGQTDREFWFAAPDVTPSHNPGGGQPIFFNFSTLDLPATITISMPANPAFIPISINLAANSSFKQVLDPFYNQIVNKYDNLHGIPGKSNKGILITSDALITAYYEYSNFNNSDIWSLKGRNALGSEFFTSFQTRMMNMNSANVNDAHVFWAVPATSSFDIVFTEDNTFITLDIPAGKGIYNGANPYHTGTVVLGPFNRGETYSGIPAWITNVDKGPKKNNDVFGRSGADHLAGVRIRTNQGKKIAVSLKDDSMKSLVGGCYELAGDQTVPVNILGTEYIAMRGQLTSGNLNTTWYNAPPANPVYQESLYILATRNNTEIFIDGVSAGIFNAGQTHVYRIPNTKDYVHVRSADSAVYVFQITGSGCEFGGAILPPISKCTGSTQVGFSRSYGPPNNSSYDFFLNIMVRKGAEDGFLLNGAPSPWLAAAVFQDVPGSANWKAARIGPLPISVIPVLAQTMISNTKDVFHLGAINGNLTGGSRYGYFSDFNELKIEAFITASGSSDIRLCHGDKVQLVARGGTRVSWNPATYLTDAKSFTPMAFPPKTTRYVATVTGACNMTDSTSITIQVAPPIIPNFTIDTVVGCSPFEAKINDKSRGVRKYTWDFGDGVTQVWNHYDTIVRDTSFVKLYDLLTPPAQDYMIRLVVENTNQCRDTLERVVRVYPRVGATFTPVNTIGCHPLEINFTNLSTNTNSWVWDFGDGGSSSQFSPFHSFSNTGMVDSVYTTRLVATSEYLCRDTFYTSFRVHPYIEADFTFFEATVCAPFNLPITNRSKGPITLYKWNFDDGSPISNFPGATFNHLFNNTGPASLTRNIHLEVQNHAGCVHSLSRPLIVRPAVTAAFTRSPAIGCDSMLVSHTNSSTGPPGLKYYWDFGDGGSSDQTNPNKIFVNKGSSSVVYLTKLVVETPQYCYDSISLPVTVHPYVSSQFTFENPSNCTPFPITLHNQSVRGHQFDWTFGGGSTDTITTNNNSFLKTMNNPSPNTTQNYTIGLRSRNNEGCEAYSERVVTVYPRVVALFNPSVISGCNPLDVRFTNQSTGGSLVYAWDFGDKNNSSLGGAFVDNKYINTSSNDTVFRAKLRVTNPLGCFSEHERNITVYARIKAGFTINKAEGCSPLDIQFTNTSGGGVQFYNWNFGDGTGTNPNPVFNRTYFNLPGNLPVQRIITLTVQNNHAQCTDVWRDTIMVYPAADARFEPRVTSGCNPLAVKFDNFSNNRVPTTYAWEMGNGASSSLWEPDEYTYSHFESTDQVYQPKLTATTVHGCAANTTRQVSVFAYIRADFASDISSGCSPLTTRFTNTSVGGVANNNWNFGDNTIIDNNSPVIQHVFRNRTGVPVDRVVRLTVRNTHPECTREWTDTVTVYPEVIPVVNFDSAGCSPHTVRFLSGNTIAADYYKWTFSDGQSSSDRNPQKTFNNYGSQDITYTMKLVAESRYTCKDSLTRTIHVYHKPRAQFTSNQVINCPPFDVVFNNNSISSNANYYWDFRDGYQTVTPDMRNVPHTFLNPSGPDIRNYHVRLLAETDKGCTDRDSLLIRVYPTVVANYEAIMEHCSPLDQRFVNTSVNADRFFWNFGDQGVTATQRNPSHVYYNTAPDEKLFNVSMRAISNYGCVDSIQKTIKIHSSPIADFSVLPSLQYFPNATFALFNDSRPNDGNWQYYWDFKDGRTSSSKDPGAYTYGHWGIYDIMLRVANDHCSDSAYQKVILVPPIPVAAFDSSHKGCSPVVMNFRNQSTWANTYLWEFDDGKMSSLANPTHVFEKPGLYNVKLTIEGDGGKSHAYQTIEVFPNPVAKFTMQPDTAMLPDAIVKAYNQSQLGVTYLWDFGDGSFSTDKDPQHTYTELGVYNVKLVAWTEHQCPDTSNIKRIHVEGAGGIVYPNAFTPNQSGPSGGFYNPADLSNDVFFPLHEGVIEYKLEIYTRWGELIFTSDDVNVGWDGYHKGQLCKQDVYIWKVKGRYTNGKTFMKAGDVTLLR